MKKDEAVSIVEKLDGPEDKVKKKRFDMLTPKKNKPKAKPIEGILYNYEGKLRKKSSLCLSSLLW